MNLRILLALFLATLSLPLLRWLLAHRVRPGLAVLATVLANIALLTAFGFALTGALNGFTKVAPGYLQQLYGMITAGLEALQLQSHLSPTRSNGLSSMLQAIRNFAAEALETG